MNTGDKALMFLISAEDTTEKLSGWPMNSTGRNGSLVYGIMQLLFWFVISIVVSLSLGQLS